VRLIAISPGAGEPRHRALRQNGQLESEGDCKKGKISLFTLFAAPETEWTSAPCPNARPILCNDWRAFQRDHTSVLCVAESLVHLGHRHQLRREDLYQMVLHRPVETEVPEAHKA
jgi:hypothetical protein